MKKNHRIWSIVPTCFAVFGLALAGSQPVFASTGQSGGSPQGEAVQTLNDDGYEDKNYGIQLIPAADALAAASEMLGEEARFVPFEEAADRLPLETMAVSGTITAGDCNYRQGNDNPHHSFTTGSKNVSVHGYWLRDSNGCPTEADVTVYLQATACGASSCVWTNVAVTSERTTPGSGSGNRINARVGCSSEATVGYRALTDVDLPWIVDPNGQTESDHVNRQCVPA